MNAALDKKLTVNTALLSAIFTVLLLLLLNYFFNHSWNFFENSQMKTQTFQSQGTGTATAAPDQSSVTFTVSKTATTLKDAQNQANTFTNKIVNDLQKTGIAKKDIQTNNYSSYPNYPDNAPLIAVPVRGGGQSQTIQSYTVSEDVTITLHNTSSANTVIDTITNDGAENISGPSLTFSDAKQQELEDQARVQAINNAKQKAQTLANAAGMHLGKIINVQESQPGTVYPVRPLMMSASGAEKSAPTQINPGQNTVTSTVTLTYQVL